MTLENGTKLISGTVSFSLHNHVKQTCDTKHSFLFLVEGMKEFQKSSVGFTMAAHPADEKAWVMTNLGEEIRSETHGKKVLI